MGSLPPFIQETGNSRVYGYLCSQILVCATEVSRTRDALTGFAERSGLCLAATFVEEDLRRPVAFERLFHAALSYDVSLILIPSLLHLAVLGPPDSIKGHFEEGAGVRVVTMA